MDIVLLLIGINVFLFILPSIFDFGMPNSFEAFLNLGAKDNPAIKDGEYYRFLTSTFLHANFPHLFVNMYSLWNIGRLVSQIFGNTQFLILYLLTGICGSIFSFIFNSGNQSVGASGSIFGLVGTLLAYSVLRGNTELLANLLFITLINLSFGFFTPNIDNWGHIGGLLSGLAVGLIMIYLLQV